MGVAAVAVVGFIIYANSNGGRDLPTPSKDAFIAPAHAASEPVPIANNITGSAQRIQRPSGYAPLEDVPGNRSNPVPLVTAMNAVPLQSTPPDAAAGRPNVIWRHVTSTGTRWSLRHVGGSSLLIIDLGGDQVANVSVAAAFEALDLQAMNFRVDHVRSIIGQSFTLQTANYSFERDGSLRALP